MKPTIEHTARLLSLQRNLLAQQKAEAGAATNERVRQRWLVRVEQTEQAINKMERQIMEQEQKDVLTIWEYIKEHGGTLAKDEAWLPWISIEGNTKPTRLFSETAHEQSNPSWVNDCAKWCKQQRKEKGDG